MIISFFINDVVMIVRNIKTFGTEDMRITWIVLDDTTICFVIIINIIKNIEKEIMIKKIKKQREAFLHRSQE